MGESRPPIPIRATTATPWATGWTTTPSWWKPQACSPRPGSIMRVVHYSAMFFCVGPILLLDLRLLGVAARNQPLSGLSEQRRPWTWIAFGAVVVSGFLLFAVEAADYAAVGPFRVKMLVIVMAVI